MMNSEKPLISVIIPIYNVEKYLPRCLDSVLAQTYENLEIWLVDDGSTDSSGRICDEYGARDERIKVIHKENGGQSEARNVALDAMTGKYVTFVDADDFIHRDMISTMYDAILMSGSDFSVAQHEEGNQNLPDDSTYTKDQVETTELSMDDYFGLFDDRYRNDLIPAWAKLYSVKVFQDLRFPVGMVYEDDYLIHYILSACKKGIYIKIPVYYHFIRENSTTTSGYSEKSLDAIKAIEDRCAFFESYGSKDLLIKCYKDFLRRIQFHYYSLKKYFPEKIQERETILENYRKRYESIKSELTAADRFRYGLFLRMPGLNKVIKQMMGARKI